MQLISLLADTWQTMSVHAPCQGPLLGPGRLYVQAIRWGRISVHVWYTWRKNLLGLTGVMAEALLCNVSNLYTLFSLFKVYSRSGLTWHLASLWATCKHCDGECEHINFNWDQSCFHWEYGDNFTDSGTATGGSSISLANSRGLN